MTPKCVVCKFYGKTCTNDCIFAPYFASEDEWKCILLKSGGYTYAYLKKYLEDAIATQREKPIDNLLVKAQEYTEKAASTYRDRVAQIKSKLNRSATALTTAATALTSPVAAPTALTTTVAASTPGYVSLTDYASALSRSLPTPSFSASFSYSGSTAAINSLISGGYYPSISATTPHWGSGPSFNAYNGDYQASSSPSLATLPDSVNPVTFDPMPVYDQAFYSPMPFATSTYQTMSLANYVSSALPLPLPLPQPDQRDSTEEENE